MGNDSAIHSVLLIDFDVLRDRSIALMISSSVAPRLLILLSHCIVINNFVFSTEQVIVRPLGRGALSGEIASRVRFAISDD